MFRLVVLTIVFAMVATNPITFWGNGFSRPLAASWSTPLAVGVAAPLASPSFASLVAPVGAVPPVGALNYRGPLSLAPGQPANILAADGRPLDTLSVNLDRAVHYTARALEGNGQRLQKRSIAVAPLAATNLAATNLAVTNLAAANLAGARYATGSLAATPLAATHLTLGRSWVGPAAVAPVAIAAATPIGL